MTALPRPSELDDQAARAGVDELARYLQETLGQRLAAALVGIRDQKQIGRYMQADGPQPREHVERRLREGWKVVRMLTEAYGEQTTRAWLFGINSRLDDRAPLEVLAAATTSSELAAVVKAARQVAAIDA